MSHPISTHDRENEYPSDSYKPSRKIKKNRSMIGNLKNMINEPVSKEWFAKHAKGKAINKLKK